MFQITIIQLLELVMFLLWLSIQAPVSVMVKRYIYFSVFVWFNGRDSSYTFRSQFLGNGRNSLKLEMYWFCLPCIWSSKTSLVQTVCNVKLGSNVPSGDFHGWKGYCSDFKEMGMKSPKKLINTK